MTNLKSKPLKSQLFQFLGSDLIENSVSTAKFMRYPAMSHQQNSRERNTKSPSAVIPTSSLPVQPTQTQDVTPCVPAESPNVPCVPAESPNLYPPPKGHDIETPSMMTNNAAVVAALQGKCDFPKNKMLMEYTKEVNERGHRLEKQPYYVGMLNADDVAPYLKKVGDFGIHACDQEGGQVRLMLTVRGHTGIYHFDLVFDAKGRGWNFNPMPPRCLFHKTIIELVEFHKTTPLPTIPEKICLRDSITRPAWFLKHENVTYNKKDLLGKGNFCEVFRGQLDRRKLIAVKVCRANWRYTEDTVDLNTKEKDARDALIKEGSVMSRIRHQNIITFYGICCDHPPIMIALEFCPGNSLIKHLNDMKEGISVGERIKYLYEAAAGMAFLEKNELVHRDLAARNCLISKYGKVKIADFGLSKLVTQLAGEDWKKQQVPVRWMAPETLKRNPEYSSKSDVWAYGILTWEVFSYGDKPWPDWENKKIATYIRRGQMMDLPEYTPKEVKSLVAKMWTLKTTERPNFAEILKRIIEIQQIFPAPKPQNCTITHIKGVHIAPEVEQEQDSEDIQITAAAFSTNIASTELLQSTPSTPRNAAQSTAEDHEQNQKKKKKKHRTGCCLLDFILNRGRSKSYEELPPNPAATGKTSSPVEKQKKKKSNKQQAFSAETRSMDTCPTFDKTDLTPSTEQKPSGSKALKKKGK